MIVNITIESGEEADVITADKTYEEINNALLSGTPILAKVESDSAESEYYGAVSNAVSKIQFDLGYVIGFIFGASGLIGCMETNEWLIV